MFTKLFWMKVAERAGKTVGQFVAYAIVGDHVGPLADHYSIDWKIIGTAVVSGAVLSLATSLASIPVGDGDSPSLVDDTPGRHAK